MMLTCPLTRRYSCVLWVTDMILYLPVSLQILLCYIVCSNYVHWVVELFIVFGQVSICVIGGSYLVLPLPDVSDDFLLYCLWFFLKASKLACNFNVQFLIILNYLLSDIVHLLSFDVHDLFSFYLLGLSYILEFLFWDFIFFFKCPLSFSSVSFILNGEVPLCDSHHLSLFLCLFDLFHVLLLLELCELLCLFNFLLIILKLDLYLCFIFKLV